MERNLPEVKKFYESFGIVHIRKAPYQSQANGQAEWFVDTFNRSPKNIAQNYLVAAYLKIYLQRRTQHLNLCKTFQLQMESY